MSSCGQDVIGKPERASPIMQNRPSGKELWRLANITDRARNYRHFLFGFSDYGDLVRLTLFVQCECQPLGLLAIGGSMLRLMANCDGVVRAEHRLIPL